MANMKHKEDRIKKYHDMLSNLRINFKRGKVAYDNSRYSETCDFYHYLSSKMYNLNIPNYYADENKVPYSKNNPSKKCDDVSYYTHGGVEKIISNCLYRFPTSAFLHQYCDIFDINIYSLLNEEIDYSIHSNLSSREALAKDKEESLLADKNHDDVYLTKNIDIDDGKYYFYFPSFDYNNEESDAKKFYEASMEINSNTNLANNKKDIVLSIDRRSYITYTGTITIHENNSSTIYLECVSDKNFYMIISIYHNQHSQDSKYYGSSGYLINITPDGSKNPCVSKCVLSTKKLSELSHNDDKKWFQSEWFEGLFAIDSHLIAIRKKEYVNTRNECNLPSNVTPNFIGIESIDHLTDDSILLINVFALRDSRSFAKMHVKNIRKFIFLLKKRSYVYCNSSIIDSIDNNLVRMYIKYVNEE